MNRQTDPQHPTALESQPPAYGAGGFASANADSLGESVLDALGRDRVGAAAIMLRRMLASGEFFVTWLW